MNDIGEARERYERKKERISAEFKKAAAGGAGLRLGKKTSNLFRSRTGAKRVVDVADLNCVLAIDGSARIAEVEGMTTFDDLSGETLKHGLLPAVVPELKSITAGGAVAGVAIESSSFRYGLFHETVGEMEVMLGSGEVIRCSRTDDSRDLFFGFPNTYGTLGYALKLKVSLVPAKRFVELRHQKYTDPEKFFEGVAQACGRGDLDFVDGTIFDRDAMYLTTARFVDAAPFVSDYTYLHIYYHSIREREVDYLTAYAYIWRWDTDWFWCSKNFGLQNRCLRVVARPWLRSTAYWKIMQWNRKHHLSERIGRYFGRSGREESVIQDVQIPVERAAEFLAFFHDRIGIKPVWICPTKAASTVIYPTYPMESRQLYLNFGFWDVVPLPEGQEDGYYNRQVEQWVDKLAGRKSLYSTTFYDRETFWEHFGGENYRMLKQKYDPQGRLNDLYDKVVRSR
jgi:FAD/FMN-containing dehydrogenase